MRIEIGANVSNKDDRQLGYISNIYLAKLNQIDDHTIAFLCGAFLGVMIALFI